LQSSSVKALPMLTNFVPSFYKALLLLAAVYIAVEAQYGYPAYYADSYEVSDYGYPVGRSYDFPVSYGYPQGRSYYYPEDDYPVVYRESRGKGKKGKKGGGKKGGFWYYWGPLVSLNVFENPFNLH